LSAELVPIFADRGCHVVSLTDRYGRILGFLDRSRYFFFQAAAKWAPFKTHYFSENLVTPGIEPGPLDL
jgi:CBS-domain-containing membrane protein